MCTYVYQCVSATYSLCSFFISMSHCTYVSCLLILGWCIMVPKSRLCGMYILGGWKPIWWISFSPIKKSRLNPRLLLVGPRLRKKVTQCPFGIPKNFDFLPNLNPSSFHSQNLLETVSMLQGPCTQYHHQRNGFGQFKVSKQMGLGIKMIEKESFKHNVVEKQTRT